MNLPHNYTPEELGSLGFVSYGENTSIDRSVRIFGDASLVSLGRDVRIDAFCVLSIGPDGIAIGDNVHIAVGCYLFGGGGRITLQSFSGLSARVTIYTSSDDYLSGALTNPTVDSDLRCVTRGPVTLERHAVVGAGSILLPNIHVGFGGAIGALSVVRRSIDSGEIVVGNPTKRLAKARDTDRLRELEATYLSRDRKQRTGR